MKMIVKRLTALLLALAMSMSLLSVGAWAASADASFEESSLSADSLEDGASEVPDEEVSLPDAPGEEPTAEEFIPEEEAEAAEAETVPEEAPPAEEEAAEAVPEVPAEEEALLTADPWSQYNITGEKSLSLQYDDRYTVSVSGYTVAAVQTNEVTSYAVEGGAVTSTKDAQVLTFQGNQITATGVGSAKVLLTQSSTGNALIYNVTVEPAPLTVMFLTGQSNMEGYCALNRGYETNYSIANEEGQVYSTYAPKSSNGETIAGIPGWAGLSSNPSEAKVRYYVPGSLTGTAAQNGQPLTYPLNALTTAGKGKTGPDSALAYQWHKRTGDKVWTINTAWGGSTVSEWQSGSLGARSLSVNKNAVKTLNAEVSAGHYVEKKRLMFWLQGEYDDNTPSEEYMERFQSIYCGLDGNGGMKADLGIDACGIIVCRALNSGYGAAYQAAADVKMSGARIAQYLMANRDDLPNVYLVSNINEQWITDAAVAAYFKGAYPGGKLTYPVHGSAPALPKNVAAVHNDIHYAQVGHNENGLTAAENLYKLLNTSAAPDRVRWLDEDGATPAKEAYCTVGQESLLLASVEPLYALKKNLTYEIDSSIATYDVESGTLTGVKSGTTTLTLKSNGTVLSFIKVIVYSLASPRVKLKEVNGSKAGVNVQWTKVEGAKSYAVFRINGSSGWTGSSSWTKLATVSDTSYVDTTAKPGQLYTYTVRCMDGSSYASGYYHFGAEAAGVTLENTSKGISLSWPKVNGSTRYHISQNGKRIDGEKATATSFIDTSAKTNGAKYTYNVTPWNLSPTSASGLTTTVVGYYLTAPKLSAVKSNASKKLTAAWKKNAKATGYEVQYGLKKDFSDGKTVTVKGASALNKTLTGLKSKKKYYVRVRAYKTASGVKSASAWSSALSVSVK